MKLDILVFAVHPDDAELGCSGTLINEIAKGKKVGIIDLTSGQLGTRGTSELRIVESMESAKILKLAVRENLGMEDGFFSNDKNHQVLIIKAIRKFKPEIVLANAKSDRHPDHGRASELVTEASFYSGLRMLKTYSTNNVEQDAWRPKNLFYYIQDRYLEPDFVIDISANIDVKMKSIKAFKSQFFDPSSNEPESYISSPEFTDFVFARAQEMGHKIGVKYGEGFQKSKTIAVKNLFDIL